ncbi:MAG: HDOD domain-containing protein [Planctomycetaceae bacterium]|jgi:HD-like signal output (HDOD) protein|nr:HDOD domain-containing protein [Planctomycetaceae bacterium]
MSSVHDELSKILTIEQLPAMPHSALSVLQLDNDIAKVNINDLVRPIEADIGLATQVLKFLNSSYFGFQSTISNVKQGIALVGIRIVKNFVLWKAVFSLIPKSKTGSFDVAMLWQDSLRRAMFSRFLLLELKKGDPETAFAGALLQDMAIPLLLKKKPNDYAELLNRLTQSPHSRLSTLENETFGWNHADAGALLGKNWKLPAPLVNLVENHLKIAEYADNFAQQPEQLIVSLSALLPSVTEPVWNERAEFNKVFQHILSEKGNLLTKIFDKVDREFEQYATIIQITKPKKSLFNYLDEE